MNMMLTLTLSLSAFLLFLCLHIIVWRLPRLKSRGFLMMICLFILAYKMTLAFCKVYCHSLDLDVVCVSGSVYLLLMMLYMHFYAGILRSVSVRILGELADSPIGRLTIEELNGLYPKNKMVRDRVEALVRNGWFIENSGRLKCAAKGRIMARAGHFFSKLYQNEGDEGRVVAS